LLLTRSLQKQNNMEGDTEGLTWRVLSQEPTAMEAYVLVAWQGQNTTVCCAVEAAD